MLLYVPPGLFLWRYATQIRALQLGGGLPALEKALVSQKSFWRFVGIITLVLMFIYGVALLGVVLSGALFRGLR